MTKVCNSVPDVLASTQKYMQSEWSRRGQYTHIELYKLPKIVESKKVGNVLRKQTKVFLK